MSESLPPSDPDEEPTLARTPDEPPTVASDATDEAATQKAGDEPTLAQGATEEPTLVASAAGAEVPPPAVTTAAAKRHISKGRLVGIDVLIGITTVLAIIAMLSVWANRLLFNPDQWEAQSTQLLQDPSIRATTANYVVSEIYAHVDVGGLIGQALPAQLKPLADPAAGALQNAAVSGVEDLLTRPAIQTIWAKANRAADQAFVTVVNGGKGPVGIKKGTVTLDLGSIVTTVAAQLGLPPSLSSKLPPSVATLTLFHSDQLGYVQTIGKLVKGLALWLTILVPLLYLLAIFLARGHRRRTLLTVGFAIILAGIAGFGIREIFESKIVDAVATDASLRQPIKAAVTIGTELLGQIAGAFLLVGVAVVLSAWFAGPSRLWTPVRHALAPYMRDHALWTFGAVLGLMILIFIWNPIPATGTLGGIVVFTVLAMFGTAMLRRETAAEFPDAVAGEFAASLRARWHARQERRHSPRIAGGSQLATVAGQLEQLADLRERGLITADDYEQAKRSLLGL